MNMSSVSTPAAIYRKLFGTPITNLVLEKIKATDRELESRTRLV